METNPIRLSDLIDKLPIPIPARQQWAVAGAEVENFQNRFALAAPRLESGRLASLDGLILAGALSGQPVAAAEAWLRQIAAAMKEAAILLVIDWQADGPPQPGPDLDQRFKKGRLCRLLRQAGFGLVETLSDQSAVYVVKAIKSCPPVPVDAPVVAVAALADLDKNMMMPVELGGQALIVANTGREIVAFARRCPHAGAALDQGLLRGRNIACPRHGYIWNVRSGQPVQPDDEDTLIRYPVHIDPETGQILVTLRPEQA